MMKIKKIENSSINNLNVQGQGCQDDCIENNVLVGKTSVNTSGCVIYGTVYTPKLSTLL